VIVFRVDGEPVPQGSVRAFNNRIVHVKPRRLMAWRQAIEDAYPGEMFDGPITVKAVFSLTRPKTVTRPHPSVKPDIDKLTRALLDALTGRAYVDDSQVVWIDVRKVYGPPGVDVTVIPWPV